MEIRERSYFAAVSLNNSAIRLIERGHYPQALSVLRDSIVAMRDAAFDPFHRLGDNRHEIRNSTDTSFRASVEPGGVALNVDVALNRASRFVIDSNASPAPAYGNPRVRVESQVLDVDVPNLTTQIGSFPVATLPLLRIDAALWCRYDDDNAVSDDEVSVASHLASISILYNMAVAALLHPLPEQDHRKGAVDALSLALHLTYRLLSSKSGGPFVTVAALQLAVMVSQCNYQIHVELGDCRGAWDSLTRYRAVQGALSQELRTAILLEGLACIHAKAA